MERSTIWLQTKKSVSLLEVINIMREFGNVRISKVEPDCFWCQFVDIASDETIKSLMNQVLSKHSKFFASVRGHKEISTYYLANQ